MNQKSGTARSLSAEAFTEKQGQYLAFIYTYSHMFRRPPAETDMQRHSCAATKFVLFVTSLPRLSIGCAITGLIATAVSNHAGGPADVWSNADSWVAKPSQAVQYRRD